MIEIHKNTKGDTHIKRMSPPSLKNYQIIITIKRCPKTLIWCIQGVFDRDEVVLHFS